MLFEILVLFFQIIRNGRNGYPKTKPAMGLKSDERIKCGFLVGVMEINKVGLHVFMFRCWFNARLWTVGKIVFMTG